MPADPFLNELVEAAAKALLGSGPLPTTWDESWEELPKHQRRELRSAGAAVLAAVLPLIEQRVIERLAREADGRAQRLRDAIHAADRELITIADFSVQEAADAIDSVRASLKDALAEN